MALAPYLNIAVTLDGREYRCPILATGRSLGVFRLTKNSETAIDPDGRKAKAVLKIARKMMEERIEQSRRALDALFDEADS